MPQISAIPSSVFGAVAAFFDDAFADQGWRLPRPPAGFPAGVRAPAEGLPAGLLRGFCALNGLPLETFA
ncbi:hypothetical protein, partial [Frateuria sp.]|uniref:hypothetical protein n=1 Tax=Frateuria sp. TaxID=2211372 RepID=UPI003F82378E